MKLRDYQEEAVAALMAQHADRDHVHVVSLPMGAGKTLVLKVFLDRWLTGNSRCHVLIVAPNWPVLEQIHETLLMGRPESKQEIGLIRGKDNCLGGSSKLSDRKVYLTTLHTWNRRYLAKALPVAWNDEELLVVIDESHWAMNAQLGKALRLAYLGKVTMVGLSATPNVCAGSDYRVAYHKTYAELCPEYLARPIVRTVSTGEVWEPDLRNGIINPTSLACLGCRATRNDRIVRECEAGL